jgi:L-ascorbate metabolism protein UlaG (beta-lactamase superfamily)
MSFHGPIRRLPGAISEPGAFETSPAPSAVAVTWLGHATAVIELDGVRLLTDPLLRDRIGPLVRVAPEPREDAAAAVDAILLSHLHYDHTDLPSLARFDHAIPIVAPRGAGRWLEAQGLANVMELAAGEHADVGSVRVTATRAVHDGRRRPFGPSAQPIGFVVSGSSSVYFAGDTDLFPERADMAHAIEAALLPVSGWGPTLGEGHLDPERAAVATALMAPRLAIPVHWGTFALPLPFLGPDDPERPAREFDALVSRHAPAVEVRVLSPGDRTTVP